MSARPTGSFLAAATLLVAVCSTLMLGSLDLIRYGQGSSVGDVAQALGLWILVGGLLAVPLALAAGITVRLLPTRLPRLQWVSLGIAFANQIVLFLYLDPRVAVVLLPLNWVLFKALVSMGRVGELRYLLIMGVALVPAFFLVTVVAIGVQPSIGSRLATLGAALVVLLSLWVTHRKVVKSPASGLVNAATGMILLSVCLPLMGPLASWAASAPTLGAPSPPHVVLIVLDTTRADHMGAYGSTAGLTPNFDRLAAESTLYEQAFSVADWTVPSHASLFTGLTPITHGATFRDHRWLDDDFLTLAEMLKGEGYETLGLVSNAYVRTANLQQGLDDYVYLHARAPSRTHRLARLVGFPAKWADKGAGNAARELEGWLAAEHDPNRPVFLFVNLLEPHWRYLPPAKQRFEHVPIGQSYLSATWRAGLFYGVLALAGQLPDEATASAVGAFYAAAVAYQDEQLGHLLETIERRLGQDDVLLIVTADHGENLGEAGRWDHVFAVNDALLHVPLLIHSPGRFPPGLTVSGQCDLTDVVPTVLDVLELTLPSQLPGRTLVPAEFEAKEFLFAESVPYYSHLARMEAVTGFERDIGSFTHVLRSARRGRYKLVHSSDGTESLFDLDLDREESTNIIDAHPEIAEELRVALIDWVAATPRYAGPGLDQSTGLSEAQRARLRALGYLR